MHATYELKLLKQWNLIPRFIDISIRSAQAYAALSHRLAKQVNEDDAYKCKICSRLTALFLNSE